MDDKIRKVSIIISKGGLEGVYPGLIMANGARMEGIEANLFFTFFGVATVGNPGMHMPSLLGILPGFSAMATSMMKKTMDKIDIPPVPEFVEMIADAGGKFYACKATVDMFKLKKEDFCAQVDSIINVGKFYEIAAGGEIIFT